MSTFPPPPSLGGLRGCKGRNREPMLCRVSAAMGGKMLPIRFRHLLLPTGAMAKCFNMVPLPPRPSPRERSDGGDIKHARREAVVSAGVPRILICLRGGGPGGARPARSAVAREGGERVHHLAADMVELLL